MFSELDQTVAKAVVSSAFKQFDTRGAGTLAFRDICFGLATSCISSWDVRAKFMFSWFGSDGELTRDQILVFLSSVVSAVRHAVEYGDSGLRLPVLVPFGEEGQMEFHARGFGSPVRERSLPEMELERIQSCVTAVQSDVYSAIPDNRSSNHCLEHPEIDLTENEKAWIDAECFALMGDAVSIKYEGSFLPWSIRNCHYLYKLLELFEIVPSPERERRTCLSILRQANFSPGSTWFVMSYKWIQLWRSYVHWSETDSMSTVWSHGGLASPTASPRTSQPDFNNILHTMSTMDAMSCTSTVIQQRMAERPMAINNSDLEGELKGALKANLVEHHDYVLVPEDMWRHLTEWYGGGPAFPRKVTSFKIRKLSSMMSSSIRHIPSSAIELYPPLILVVMCGDKGLPVRHFTKRFFVSRQDSCGDLIAQLARKLVNKNDPSVCRLWHRQSGESWELILADDPRRIDDFVGSVTTEAGTFMIEVMGRNGSWPRDKVVDQDTASHAMNELQVGDRVDAKSVNTWRRATVVDVGTDGSVKVHFDNEQYKNDAWLNCDSDEIAPPGTHVAEGESEIIKKGFFKKSKKISTAVASGLENIGNTCFMNATLQCLSSTPMLKEYFISNEFQKHMRADQKVAGEFASLLSAMVKSSKGYVAPTAFKKALEKYAPRFIGYEHQDAHELLAVLLDGLHEDLNICPEKSDPKAPVPEGQDVGESEWHKHRSKHTSVIADLFDGQQRIVTECNTCHSASSIYEAFRYVMLPVPVTEYRKLNISVVLLGAPAILRFSVLVHKAALVQSAINTLASQHPTLTAQHKIDWDHGLVLAEVYMSRIHRFIDSSSQVSDFRSEDKLFAFQIDQAANTTSSLRGNSMDLNISSSLAISSNVSNTVVGSPAVVHTLETEPTTCHNFFAQIIHRREVVVKRSRKPVSKREVFGLPLVIAINPRWSGQQVLAAVKAQVHRFVSSTAPRNSAYVVRVTSPDGTTCSGCGKASCAGCAITGSSTAPIRFKGSWLYLAVDWVSDSYYDASSEVPSDTVNRNEPKPVARTRTSGVCHLYDCFDAYTATESMSGENKWFCEKCNEKSDADRRISWHMAPDVLVVLLKRFQFTHAGFEKIGVPITFPVSDLELRTKGSEQETYDLYGVVNHYGSLSSGHYTAMCRREDSGWFLFNDRRVMPVPLEELAQEIQNCAKSCYVLFYKRRGTRPANLINYTFPSGGSE